VDDLLTTRQLQDLLRVDRVTIYRMLNDGRLRGFKVGGLWRFPRRAIEAWLLEHQAGSTYSPTLSTPSESAAPSSHVLPITCIRAVQAVCAEALDIAIVTTGLDGDPLAGVDNSCDFCNLVLATEAGRLRCAESWRKQPDGEIHTCHAGLLCASFPIAVQGQTVALVAGCQFTAGDAVLPWQPNLHQMAANLGLAEAELKAVGGCVRIVPENALRRIPRLLHRVADTFSEIGQERVNLVGRLEKIAEMSKI